MRLLYAISAYTCILHGYAVRAVNFEVHIDWILQLNRAIKNQLSLTSWLDAFTARQHLETFQVFDLHLEQLLN